MMFPMSKNIKSFGIAVAIIRSQLKTIKILDIIKCLVAIEMLQVWNTILR